MPSEKPVTPKRPSRMMGILLAILILGGVVLALFWKEKPSTPVSSSPAAATPKHNADPAPKTTP